MYGTDQIVVDQHGLQVALVSVRAEKHRVDDELAEELIERVYAIRNGETGDQFRTLFDRVIAACKIPDDTKRGYELVLGRYFNPRAVEVLRKHPEKRKGPWIPTVVEANIDHVLMQVYPEVQIDFKPYPRCRMQEVLEWDDIKSSTRALSGSTYVRPTTFRQAKVQAMAILNKCRAPQPLLL